MLKAFAALLIILFSLFMVFVLAGVKVIRSIYRTLFGGLNGRQGGAGNQGYGQQQQQKKGTTQWYSAEEKKEKVFSKVEGEYIDFEEIKDSDLKHS